MKELSDWQLDRVRNALRAYHRYERGADGEYFTWRDVREAIAEYTGVDIGTSIRHGAERLRQFVEGIKDKKAPDGWRFATPKSDAMVAIVAFVIHEDLNLLTEDELNEYLPACQAPLRLLEYLEQAFDTQRFLPPAKLEGRYQTHRKDGELFIVRELTLQRPSEEGIVQVIETEEHYDTVFASLFDNASYQTRKESRKSLVRYQGWLILTPEDNLLFFMKKDHNGMNRYYLTMAAELKLWSDDPHTRLIVLDHSFPVELTGEEVSAKKTLKTVAQTTARNVVHFAKVD